MPTRIHIVLKGTDHVEVQVDDEAAADRVADEAHKKKLGPVIGQRQGSEHSSRHYVVLNGPGAQIMAFLQATPGFEIV